VDDGTVARRETAAAWDLRAAWATRRPVVLTLDAAVAALARVAGYVERVSPTGARCDVDDLDVGAITVPCRVVLAVRRPHFHEPADARAATAPARPPRDSPSVPGQLSFDLVDDRHEKR
jgi:hypothetical protein